MGFISSDLQSGNWLPAQTDIIPGPGTPSYMPVSQQGYRIDSWISHNSQHDHSPVKVAGNGYNFVINVDSFSSYSMGHEYQPLISERA
jgi:hypothetical protein